MTMEAIITIIMFIVLIVGLLGNWLFNYIKSAACLFNKLNNTVK